jgi:ribosomal protein L11 methyltransferase
MDYLELNIKISPIKPFNEIIVAQLAEIGFESFIDTDDGLIACVQVGLTSLDEILNETILGENREDVDISFNHSIIKTKNWNEIWENNFEKVIVEDYATILAPFHDKNDTKGLIIEIQPKMSFGTGHHQTTWMMIKSMFELNKIYKNVLDHGTGTGILAIVAEKLGAEYILAVDIEEWAIENAIENAKNNNCKNIEIILKNDLKYLLNYKPEFDL